MRVVVVVAAAAAVVVVVVVVHSPLMEEFPPAWKFILGLRTVRFPVSVSVRHFFDAQPPAGVNRAHVFPLLPQKVLYNITPI